MVRVRRGNGEGTIGMPRPDVLSQEGPPRGTLMPHLNAAEELVNPRGTEREGKRSSVSRFVVYNKPILATLFGTKGKAGLKKTNWEATAIIHCGITGASQTRNSLTTMTSCSLSSWGAVVFVQRAMTLNAKPLEFRMGNGFEL